MPLLIYAYLLITPSAPSPARSLTITRVFQDGVELNWLPPTEPNGEVHYVIEYKREDSGDWTSVNTTSDSTHYNLTGLHSGTSYIIRVVAVNSAGRAPIATTPTSNIATAGITVYVIAAGAAAAFLLLLTLLTTGIVIMGVVVRRARKRKAKFTYIKEEGPAEQVEFPVLLKYREQQNGVEFALHHEGIAQTVGDLHYERTDVPGLGMGQLTGVQFMGDYYDIFDGKCVPAKDEVGFDEKKYSQPISEPTDNQNVVHVYAVADKSKKRKMEQTPGGPSATTTRELYKEESNNECSNVHGKDWYENVVEETPDGSHDSVAVMGTTHNDAMDDSPKPEPCNPNVVYAVVDKSRKRNKGKTVAVPNPTAADIDSEEDAALQQHGSGEEGITQQNDNEQTNGGSYPKAVDSSAPYTTSGLQAAPDILM